MLSLSHGALAVQGELFATAYSSLILTGIVAESAIEVFGLPVVQMVWLEGLAGLRFYRPMAPMLYNWWEGQFGLGLGWIGTAWEEKILTWTDVRLQAGLRVRFTPFLLDAGLGIWITPDLRPPFGIGTRLTVGRKF